MKIHRIYHSGFAIELNSCTLLFDWWKKDLPELAHDKPLYVFVSHIHSDHYDERIWELGRIFADVHYVLDSALAPIAAAHPTADVCRVTPHQHYALSTLLVDTLESNDEGVAFYVQADEKRIFFAGDLNVWWWDRPMEENQASQHFFEREIARLPPEPLDVAFLPLDPRLQEGAPYGIASFMNVREARALVPMHYGDDRRTACTYLSTPELVPYEQLLHFEDYCEL